MTATRIRSFTMFLLAVCVALFVTAASVRADVRLPQIFGNHMVLQREKAIPVWGWSDPGEEVTVRLGSGEPVSTTANSSGQWKIELPPHEAGGPLELVVTGNNTVTLGDVLVGEVWLCSGQSNMEWSVDRCLNPEQEKAAANFPQIRHIKIPKRPASFPADDVEAQWTVCSPETVAAYTAAGYYFGRTLHKELDVPVGLVNSSWGGTRIEPWTPPCGFDQVDELADILKQVELTLPHNATHKERLGGYLKNLEAWLAEAKTSLQDETPAGIPPTYPAEIQPLTSHQSPTTLYNGMIDPLVPFAIRGAIWYQGESNHSEGMLYYHKMHALVRGWRQVWNQGEFPFLYVQIAPFQYGNESPGILPVFWEAQARALDIPNSGMVVIHDVGNLTDIHPKNKQEVGRRLALIALAKTYGRPNVVFSGPTFKSLATDGDQLRVTFDHVGSGLVSNDGQPLDWFEIVGPESDWTKAAAKIDADSVVLSAPEVKNPQAVRFAWHKLAEPNLANKEGLPAVPFRAGEVPKRDWLALKIEEAKDYTLVYDLDLAQLGRDMEYAVDATATIDGPFDRIAYFLELQKHGGDTQYAYVSMDAFTDDIKKIGVPTAATKAAFQQSVANMNVVSNVAGIAGGNGLTGGNIEFWPNNYGPGNQATVPGASSGVYDFGDDRSNPLDGYGCMQVHNHEAKQTVFALNHWNVGDQADVGIGNSGGDTRDWTFAANATQYEVKRLRVLVREK